MADFQEELQKWFIDMGYPVENVKETDWKIMCCGRLPEYWKSVMSSTRSKQEVNNILRNFALKEIKAYDKRKHSSAAKIGTLIPPPQIYYPKEQERLKKELDLLKIKLNSKKHEYKNKMDERKRKCYELHVTKQDIVNAERQIFAMKETQKKLMTDLNIYKNKFESAIKYKNNFINDFPECNGTELIKKQHDVNIEQLMESYLQNTKLQNKYNNKDISIKDDIMDNLRTSEMCNMIIHYQKCVPQLMKKKISESLCSDRCDNPIKYKSLKDNLLELKLFHCKVVIATIQLKKECERAKAATNSLKSKTLEALDVLKFDLFNQECSRACAAACQETFLKELSDLKVNAGFYGSLPNSLNLNKSSDIDILQKSITIMKEKYMSLHLKSQSEIRNICSQLEIIKQTNGVIKGNILEIKNSRKDKILWHPDYKQIQDRYLKIILKNPSLLKTESDNPFACLTYLLTIISDYNMNEKLMKCKEINLKQMLWYKNILKNGVNDDLKRQEIEELNFNEFCKKMYLQSSYSVLYALVQKLRFKNSLEDMKITYESSQSIDDILGNYADINYLEDSEEKILLQISQFLKKNHTMSKIDSIINEINEIHDFFNNFQSTRKLQNERSF